MSTLETIAATCLVFAIISFLYMGLKKPRARNAGMAAVLALAFGAFTIFTIGNEGAEILWANQTVNLWGVQVWIDLLLSALIAFYFIAPRAADAGMNVPLWTLFVISTLSVGLLAMVARLFWLEARAKG